MKITIQPTKQTKVIELGSYNLDYEELAFTATLHK